MKLVSAKSWCALIPALLGAGLVVLIATGVHAGSDRRPSSQIMGWVENVRLFPGGLLLTAKLDTGARTSSIDVPRYEIFARDGRQWVRFRVSDRKGATIDFERPVVRIARIRRSESKTTKRPVVMLGLCLGTWYRGGRTCQYGVQLTLSFRKAGPRRSCPRAWCKSCG